jgi:hypothetical protein
MKKATMYNRLQKQYEKLNQSIQKAMKTGRFYAYTQFKQEQLLSRLKRCSFQLKQLGAGVAVVAALGVATPAVGQSSFLEKTGTDNPCALLADDEWHIKFVDIDGDGDLDCFSTDYVTSPPTVAYYENTGTASSANYVRQTGANNPFDGVADPFRLSFVDIDGDGDQDCFFSIYGGADPYGPTLSYYENTGSATSPVFALQALANNPLDMVRMTVGQGGQVSTSFVDIDNDGDMDCFVGNEDYNSIASPSFLYYENTGTVIAPTFTPQLGVGNPLSSANLIISSGNNISVQFEDMDADNDLDAFILNDFAPNETFRYYENTGNLVTPSFVLSVVTPLDSIDDFLFPQKMTLVDIDNDSDIDVFLGRLTDEPYRFWENRDTVVISSISELEREEKESIVYPNPTGGQLSFETPITGEVKVYTISGQLLLNLELFEEQSINLDNLQNGLYFLEIQTEKGRIREKVMIQK